MSPATRVGRRRGAPRVASVSLVLATLAVPLIGSVPAAAQTPPPACSSSHLSSFDYAQVKRTTKYVTVVYVNTSPMVCVLRGYPDVVMFGPRGPIHSTQRDVFPASNKTVVLPPNGEAGFVLWFRDVPLAGVDPATGCARALNLHATIATSGPADLTVQYAVNLALCDDAHFLVTALQHGVPKP